MDNAKLTLKKIKNHVAANKVAYAMGVVAVSAIALQQANRISVDKFMVSKGIDPEEYYCPEAYAEKNEK